MNNEHQILAGHADRLSAVHLRELLSDTNRFDEFSREAVGLLVDFSRQCIDAAVLGELFQLAGQKNLSGWIERLFAGDAVNDTEQRAALHMALRAGEAEADGNDFSVDGQDVMTGVLSERARMLDLAQAIRDGVLCGSNGKALRRIINIGIGGSDLGVAMACSALENWRQADLDMRFVSGIDGVQLQDALRDADPDTTLFIVCSKTFTTDETLANAGLAREWLTKNLGGDAVAGHFVAVSCNQQAMDDFGIAPERRLQIPDWVGGRYSVWSSMGLALAIAIGRDPFLEFLAGGREMDVHFRNTAACDNLPVLLALISVWNNNYRHAKSHLVLPYDQRLCEFPRYLQQLVMESLGKRVTRDDNDVDLATGIATWGEPGSNAQHAFMQLLHQGNLLFSVDFILPATGSSDYAVQHKAAVANCIAQAQALAYGREDQQPHRAQPGNRPSTLVMIPKLDPRSLGKLVAMYEHRVFVQSVIWGINPFDQFGVELGKKLAAEYADINNPADGAAPLPDGFVAYLDKFSK